MSTTGFGVFSEAMPLADLLVRSAERYPDRIALRFPERSYTYAELLDGAVTTARGLIALGVQAHEQVGLLMPNSIEFAEAYFGASLVGAVLVPLNARYRASELGYVIGHARLVTVLTTDRIAERTDFRAILTDSLPGVGATPAGRPVSVGAAPDLRHIVMLRGEASPGFVGADEFAEAAELIGQHEVELRRSRVRVRDTAMILYTSGTTAHPKGCLISHEAMTRGSMGRMRENVPLGDENRFWCPSPMFHIACMQIFIASIGLGGTFATDAYFEPNRAWQLVVDTDVTNLWPWFQAVMLGLERAEGFDAALLPNLQAFSLIGPPVYLRHIQELFPNATHINGSGMSELSGYYAISPLDDSNEMRATAGGKPVSGVEVRIIDPVTGEDVPAGVMGEILVRGYLLMDGYYRDPERTAEVVDADGWLHTSDLYIRDEEGHITYAGRLKDMLKVGGENVPAIEIEAFLCTHPSIRMAEVVGVPDDRLDEVPVAFVEVAEGERLDPEEIVEFCRGRIASFKVPRAVYFKRTDEWPMSATKVNKVALRAELAALRVAT